MNTTMTTTGSLTSYFAYAGSIARLTKDEEFALADRVLENNDKEAAQKLILANLRFVVYIARGYKYYGLPMEDLIQEGNIGLMKAVQKFDSKRNVRLASYAVFFIKHEIHEYVIRNWKIVKVATTKAQRKLFFKMRSLRQDVDHATEAERAMIGAKLDVSIEDVREMEKRLYSTPLSLDQAVSNTTTKPMARHEMISDPDDNPWDIMEEEEHASYIKKNLMDSIAALSERDRDIILSRHFTEKPLTLGDLSKRHNISAERVRQLELRTINNLKEMAVRL